MSFFSRSIKKFQQQATQVLSANPTPSASTPLALFRYPDDCKNMIVGSDADYKPASTSVVKFEEQSEDGESFCRFSGKTNGDGYAALRSKVPQSSFYGVPTFDVSPYKYLTLRVRGDSRRYFINLQTESYMETDLYQHRLFLTSHGTGEWETVTLKWNDFTLTNNGQIQEKQIAMDKYRLKTVGISVLDRLPGSFQLDLQWIRAENAGEAGSRPMNDVNDL